MRNVILDFFFCENFFRIVSKAPVPVKPWRGVRNAENHGRACPYLGDLTEVPENERKNIDIEDCLTMAIYSTNVRSINNYQAQACHMYCILFVRRY